MDENEQMCHEGSLRACQYVKVLAQNKLEACGEVSTYPSSRESIYFYWSKSSPRHSRLNRPKLLRCCRNYVTLAHILCRLTLFDHTNRLWTVMRSRQQSSEIDMLKAYSILQNFLVSKAIIIPTSTTRRNIPRYCTSLRFILISRFAFLADTNEETLRLRNLLKKRKGKNVLSKELMKADFPTLADPCKKTRVHIINSKESDGNRTQLRVHLWSRHPVQQVHSRSIVDTWNSISAHIKSCGSCTLRENSHLRGRKHLDPVQKKPKEMLEGTNKHLQNREMTYK